jgi:N-acetylmuramoyl-L-alanine amidase
MFSKRKADPKAEILSGIYRDNLKLAGKSVEGPKPARKRLRYGRMLPVVIILLVIALGPFVERGPSLSVNQGLSPPATALVPAENEMPATSFSGQYPTFTERGADTILERVPMLGSVGPDAQGVEDFDLMLSGQDGVRLSSLFGLGVKTIVIDPGHGGRDPGAIGALGTMEKDITLDVALRLRDRLDKSGRYHVLLTRDSDRTLALAARVEFAKKNTADLFISVHVNSLPGNETINFIETYYFGPPLNSETLKLAATENKESHFTVGEIDAIIEDIGNTIKRQESVKLAASIQQSLFNNIRVQDRNVRDIGIKSAPFVVLSQIEVPSVLVEISCITKPAEEKKLATAEYRSKVASYMEEGIVSYLEAQHYSAKRGEK